MRRMVLGFLILMPAGMASARGDDPGPAAPRGESIVVCGEKIAIGTPVILWSDPGGHNAYAPKPPAPNEAKADARSSSPGYGLRRHGLGEAELAEVARAGWTRPLLERAVDQFVIHYDVCGTSKKCFEVLQERRLSVHFMLDLDGVIYQTLDLKEAAYHATKANGRSIGIEIANMGAYPPAELAGSPLARWYGPGADGRTELRLPDPTLVPTLPPGSAPLRPSRDRPVVGAVQGQELAMYDLTPQQYAALARLTAGLCATFPRIRRDVPRDDQGRVISRMLEPDAYNRYQGILGHFHVQLNKTDPGPALRWDLILGQDRPTPQP